MPTATLPVTRNADGTMTVQATPVCNPDGTSVAAGVPASLGQKTAANSLSVVPASDATFPAPKASAGTLSAVASGIASVTILAANASRKGASITNTDANALYLDLSGGTASSTSYSVKLITDGYYEVPFGYTGLITGIWAADGSGSALVCEFV